MSSCIKCQASLPTESKFCRLCGTEQIEVKEVKSTSELIPKPNTEPTSEPTPEPTSEQIAVPTSFNREGSEPIPTSATDYSTKKMTTNPLTPSVILATPVAQTMPMTEVIGEKRKRGLFIAGVIFSLMAIFGAVMTYGVISRLNYLRSHNPPISKKIPNKSTGKIQVLESEIKTTPIQEQTPTMATPIATPIQSPESLPVPSNETDNTLHTPKISPPTPISPIEPVKEKPEPPQIQSPQIQDPIKNPIEDSNQTIERGEIRVNFKLVGKALVKIKGKQIYVIPLVDSSVLDVSRLVVNTLPNQPVAITGRQRASDPIGIVLVEKPSARNQFTATFEIESKDPNPNRAVKVDLTVRW